MQAGCRASADPGLLARAKSQAEQAAQPAGAQGEHRALGILWWALGVGQLRRSEVSQARSALRKADRELGAGDFAELQDRARASLAFAEAWQGNLTVAETTAAEVLRKDPPVQPATRHAARLTVAYVSMMRDELTAAHNLLDQIDFTEHAAIPGEPSIISAVGFLRARILVAQGDATRARVTLTQLSEEFARNSAAVAEIIASLEGEIAVRTGDHDLGRKIVTRLTADDGGPARPGDRLTLAWLLLAASDLLGTLKAAEPLIAGPAGNVRLHERVGALLVAAIAHRRRKCPERAAELLEQALMLAEPERAYRPFVDGGSAVRSVLTVLIPPTSRSAGFAGRILQRLDSQLPVGSDFAGDGGAPLSDSELAVLRFLPSHMTNEEIGEALFLSVNTVKTHLRSAYRKLGVRSRREAIALARQRGLVA